MDAEAEAAITELRGRVSKLERAQNENTESLTWACGELGKITAIVHRHTSQLERIDDRLNGIDDRLNGIDGRLGKVEAGLTEVKGEVAGLRRDMPGIVAAALREVMGPSKES